MMTIDEAMPLRRHDESSFFAMSYRRTGEHFDSFAGSRAPRVEGGYRLSGSRKTD
jgi:hypothetical protein